jgi:hypothetical protein
MSKRSVKPADPDTETFIPAVDFTGYPDGKTAVAFRAGVESIPVSKEFAQLMRDKGYVATGTLHVESEILPDGEIRPVRKYFTDD